MALPTRAQPTQLERCAAAVAGLLAARPSDIRVDEPERYQSGDTVLRWQTWRGDRGTCRVDAEGRTWEVVATRFAQRPGSPAGAEYMVCGSEGGRRRQWPIPRGAVVRLIEQESRADCIADQTWGVGDGFLWVDRGCRATFEVRRPEILARYTLTCGSTGGRRVECEIKLGADVALVEQISTAPCLRSDTWGHGDGVLWVDRGCRGRFEVRPRAPGSGTPWPGR